MRNKKSGSADAIIKEIPPVIIAVAILAGIICLVVFIGNMKRQEQLKIEKERETAMLERYEEAKAYAEDNAEAIAEISVFLLEELGEIATKNVYTVPDILELKIVYNGEFQDVYHMFLYKAPYSSVHLKESIVVFQYGGFYGEEIVIIYSEKGNFSKESVMRNCTKIEKINDKIFVAIYTVPNV